MEKIEAPANLSSENPTGASSDPPERRIKTAFFGSSRFSLPFLEFLRHCEFIELSLIVSQPDKPAGRGLKIRPSAVKEWGKDKEILTLTPSDLTEKLFLGAVSSLSLKLGVVVYYGLIIPKEVIDLFPLGILNLHHSLLPLHRGPNPIPWTILNNEKETGTTIIKINERFDAGGIVAAAKEEVRNDDTTETLRQRLDERALSLLERTLPRYIAGKIETKNQDLDRGSYEARLTKDSGRLDFSKSPTEIERTIRAFTPWPGAWTTVRELKKLAEFTQEFLDRSFKSGAVPGEEVTIVDDRRVKIIKAGLNSGRNLTIETVQVEGKEPISWEEFKRGYLN